MKEELQQLLEPPAEKWPLPSPAEIEQAYGSALPTDFLWLAETYGSGEIARYLSLFPPLRAAEIGMRSGVHPFSAAPSEYEEENEGLDPAYLEPGGLLTWGFTQNDDVACWHRVGEPDEWPVVIRHDPWTPGPTWVRHEMGVVEFLVRTIRGQLAANPFTGNELWRDPSPSFERH
ncbi:hypothetical protein CFP65_2373 [Kitasatospora sp. MMS16-BH015]|uniref:hypothetical protein n=1 Tax=Kitasatospora sp. MMS16-BH015 TaxID=2018025 RepID=UPI000CA37DCD|nr:hypothetical protein [Kitasatospora sp. MMS16-BH015]AUG77207.1 hypothetical protein CFP65_2373 [Kitasatospora sp. MMS16-BH015]